MNNELNYSKSLEVAEPIKKIIEIVRTLDVEYLTKAVEGMKENHSMRDSAMILNPSPFTANEQQELNAAKIKGIELLIALAENQNDILDREIKLAKAKSQAGHLAQMFGL